MRPSRIQALAASLFLAATACGQPSHTLPPDLAGAGTQLQNEVVRTRVGLLNNCPRHRRTDRLRKPDPRVIAGRLLIERAPTLGQHVRLFDRFRQGP